MLLDAFSTGNSPLHTLDPRVKLLAYLPVIILTALSDDIRQTSVSLAGGIGLSGIAGFYNRLLLKRLAVVNVFMIFLWLTLPFSVSGEPLWDEGPLALSKAGVILCLLITIKANAIALYTVSLPGTSTIASLSHAMLHLRVPKKLVTMFYFFYRYTGVITDEYEKMLRMLHARGFRSKTSMHTVRVYAYFTGMLFIKSYERSERVYNALLMRGFDGQIPLLAHFNLRKQDLVFAWCMGGFVLIITLL
ncbi:MAG: cobalt ECF transporter T component CbiQ [Chlorobium phaeobacteroides]|uniref:Cobalt ABC transporter, inner membrane subunit CbiQ n=1 Tax=Chlorobium phaeobacteroides (strain BS1) TaxID=331678 RepID=B3EQN6_CHLPB|nr:cobalt ECF transporter T component CbiQ [Chlorobium phaeobacteroides]NEX14746.1 cobalt ECF transporter T component CbiQ [Prosthecochloris sp.]